jgi:hypothetical protein
MSNSLQREVQTAEVNWGPRSLVKDDGTPNLCIHPVRSAAAQSAAVVDASGTASGHRSVNYWG